MIIKIQKLTIFLLSLIQAYNCVFFHYDKRDLNNINKYVKCDNIKITVPSNDQPIPFEFKVNAYCNGINFQYNFEISDGFMNDAASNTNVYIHDENGLRKIINTKKEYLYKDVENNATASLTENIDLMNKNVETNGDAFRVIISSSLKFVIAPILIESNSSKTIQYFLIKNSKTEYLDSLTFKNSKKRSTILNERKKRAVDNTKQNYYVEYLLILDSSVFNKYNSINKNQTFDQVINNIKLIYSHLANGVDMIFHNSLSSDPKIDINVKLTNILIYTNQNDTPWSNPSIVGVPNITDYFGREPIITTNAFNLLMSTMNNLSLPFKYDYALALTKKDLWDSNELKSYSARSSIISYSIASGICGKGRYSLYEDEGLFGIMSATRLLGFNFGAPMDGSGTSKACPASLNYIMTPIFGYYSDVSNLIYFSNCSIAAFKTRLATNSTFCLRNQPDLFDNSLILKNDTLPGAIWDVDSQCKLSFGAKSAYTPCYIEDDEICQELYCTEPINSVCVATIGYGALDGTKCGENKICMKKKCVNQY